MHFSQLYLFIIFVQFNVLSLQGDGVLAASRDCFENPSFAAFKRVQDFKLKTIPIQKQRVVRNQTQRTNNRKTQTL